MQKYHVEITETAEFDIQEIFDYILKDNPAAALKWVAEIERQINSLGKFPLRCALIPEAQELGHEYHHIIYGNYRTIFRIEKSKVFILRVIHGSRLLNMQLFEK